MRNINTIIVPSEGIGKNICKIEVIDLTNDDTDSDSDCVVTETSFRNVDECKSNGDIKLISQKENKVRRCLSQLYDIAKDSHPNNVHTVCHPVVAHSPRNVQPHEIPGKAIKCELNDHQCLCEDKSAFNDCVERQICNLGNNNAVESQEQKNKISNTQKLSVNDNKKGNITDNQPDEESQSQLKLAEPSIQRKYNTKHSATSKNKHINHSFQLSCESTPNMTYSFPKSSSVTRKKKLYSVPQEQVDRHTLLKYFKPLNSSGEKIALPGHSLCTNILEVPQARKENSHTNVELEQKSNQLKLHKNEEIFQNYGKNSSSGIACEGKVQNHCKETKNKCNSTKTSYITVIPNTNDKVPKAYKRHISPTAEKALPSKKKKTYEKQELKEHLSNESHRSKSQSSISVMPMRNHKVKKQVVKDFPQCEKTFHKSSTESTACTIKRKDCDDKFSGDAVSVSSVYKPTTESNITENESKCLAFVEEMLKINVSGINNYPLGVEQCHKPSNSGMKVLSSQSKNTPGKYSHRSSISSRLPQESSFNENNTCLRSTKSHKHSGGKKQLTKSNNIHKGKSDMSKSKDLSYSKSPCSTNTKYNLEKKGIELHLEKRSQAAHGEPVSEKGISTQVSGDFSSHEELQTPTITKSLLIGPSTLTNIESCENLNQTLRENSIGELDQSQNSSQIIVNTSQEIHHSGKKISIDTLVSTMKKIFSDQFCHPWLPFDTSGIPTCCSTQPYDDDLRQFNVLSNINNMIQLDLPMLAVDHFTEFIFSDGIPDAVSVQRIFQLMLETDHVDVLFAVQSGIISLLGFYPPCFVHSASYYREVFASQSLKISPVPEGLIHYLLNRLSQESENSKDENFLLPCVNKPIVLGTSNYCEKTGDSSKENVRHEKCVCRILLILSNLRDSLASDFSNWIFKYALDQNYNITKMATQPLIATTIWPRSAYYPVGAVKGVICLLVKCCVKLWSFKNLSVSDKSVLIEILHMAAEVIRYSVPFMENDYPFFGPACDALASKVYYQMNLYELDETSKENFLSSLKPDWLALKVGSLLIAEIINSAPPQHLSTMVSFVEEHYILHNSDGFIETCPNKLQNDTANTTKKVNVNKPDAKGEVMLHVACRKGNIEKVKSLLNNPHIRVNAQDYAGWTPLQEAIVKNRIECIKVLLSYNPPIGEHVDTSLANFIEGTTPLMTAARYNNLLACEMLLKHSGFSLLKQKDKNGMTAFDYAQFQELKNFLLEGEVKYKHVKKRPAISISKQGWKKLEPLLSLTIFKYMSTYKILEITETLKAKEQGSNLNTINEEEKQNSGNLKMNVNPYQYKKDYTAYRVLKRLIKNDTKGDVILDKLGKSFLWYHIHVIDNSELNS